MVYFLAKCDDSGKWHYHEVLFGVYDMARKATVSEDNAVSGVFCGGGFFEGPLYKGRCYTVMNGMIRFEKMKAASGGMGAALYLAFELTSSSGMPVSIAEAEQGFFLEKPNLAEEWCPDLVKATIFPGLAVVE